MPRTIKIEHNIDYDSDHAFWIPQTRKKMIEEEKSEGISMAVLQKAGKPSLIPKKVTVRRRGKTFQSTRWVRPEKVEEVSKKVSCVGLSMSQERDLEEEVSGIEIKLNEKFQLQPDAYTEEIYDWFDLQIEKAGISIPGEHPYGSKQIGKNIEMELYNSLQEAIEGYLNSLTGSETQSEIVHSVQEVVQKWQVGNQDAIGKSFTELFRRGWLAGVAASGVKPTFDLIDANALEIIANGPYRIGERIKLFGDETVKKFANAVGKAYTPEGDFSLEAIVKDMQGIVKTERYKLERVARTETAVISNLGRLFAWEKEGEPRYSYNYIWRHTPDNRAKEISKHRATYNPLSFDEALFLWHHQKERLPNGKVETDSFNQRCTLSRTPRNDAYRGNRFLSRIQDFERTI